MGRLRNSTWRGAQNAPHCGTRTVLVDFPPSSRAARRASRGGKANALGLRLLLSPESYVQSPSSCPLETSGFCFRQGFRLGALPLRRAIRQVVQSENLSAATERGEHDFLGFARLEAHGSAGGDVEMNAERRGAVEVERLVRLEEMIVAADLDRAVASVDRLDRGLLAASVKFDVAVRRED